MCSPGDGFVGRDGREHGDAHRLVGAQGGGEGVLPDPVPARDDDGEERAAEAAREAKRPRLERDLDAEDRALGEQEDAVSGLDGRARAAMERAGGRHRALGADEQVPPARELAAEEREGGELVAGDGGEREGKMEQGEAVGEALVQGDDDVPLVRVDVFETADVNAQTDEAGGEPSPPALGGPYGRPATDAGGAPVWQCRGEAQDERSGTEQDEDGYPGPKPLAGRADLDLAAEESASSLGGVGGGGAGVVRRHRRRRPW